MDPVAPDKPQTITLEFFERMYRSYWRRLCSLCLSKVGDKGLAEEMVQDIFCSIWERRKTLQIAGPVEHYLVRAAKIEIAAYYRKIARREGILNDVLHGFEDMDDTTRNIISAADLSKKVDQLLGELPEQSRKIFLQSRENGSSNKEIASMFAISVKAVEYHISKTLLYLRNNLHEFV